MRHLLGWQGTRLARNNFNYLNTVQITSNNKSTQGLPPEASAWFEYGYSAEAGAVGGGCSPGGQYYIVKQPIIECKPLHLVSTAPPFAECREYHRTC